MPTSSPSPIRRISSCRSKESPEEFEAEARLLLAVKLYELGRVSTGRAAELAGISRVEFMFALDRFGLSPIGVAPDELESDLPDERRLVIVNATLEADLVILDELLGRLHARRLGLPLTGTMGVLLKAKAAGLLPTVAPLVHSMRARGFRLSDALVQRVLELAGE